LSPPFFSQTLKEPCPLNPVAGHWHFNVLLGGILFVASRPSQIFRR